MKVIGALVLTSFLATVSMAALGCQCPVPQHGSLEKNIFESWSSSEAVVWAKAVSVEDIEPYEVETIVLGEGKRTVTRYRNQRTEFVAIESWKGSLGERFFTEIAVYCCVCGYSFVEGQEYLLYLEGQNEEGDYSTSSCSRTKAVEDATEEVEILRKLTSADDASEMR